MSLLKKLDTKINKVLLLAFCALASDLSLYAMKEEVVSFIKSDKNNINKKNTYGRTPLISAINNNNETDVRLLLLNNADITIGDNNGNTPADLSYINHQDCVIKDIYWKKKGDNSYSSRISKAQTIVTLISEVASYVSNFVDGISKEDVLFNAMSNKTTKFNTHEWLRLALLRGDKQQIQYCINQGLFTEEDLKNLELTLKLD